MLRTQHIRMVLPLALSILGLGAMSCSAEDPELNALAEEQALSASSTDPAGALPTGEGSGIEGTWMGSDTVGGIQMLVLMTDGRYHVARDVPCRAPAEECNPVAEQDGMYAIYVRGATHILGLVPKGSWRMELFEFVADSNSLSLRPLRSDDSWFTLHHTSHAWCASPRDCNLQSLPPAICAGAYECPANVCIWRCGGPLPPM